MPPWPGATTYGKKIYFDQSDDLDEKVFYALEQAYFLQKSGKRHYTTAFNFTYIK